MNNLSSSLVLMGHAFVCNLHNNGTEFCVYVFMYVPVAGANDG